MLGPDETKETVGARGAMQPFARQDVELIRRTLKARKLWRDLALFSLAIDSMLRGGDLVRLTVADVRDPNGKARDSIRVRQGKTKQNVIAYLMDETQTAVETWIKFSGKHPTDYLFTRHNKPHAKHISEVALRNLVKGWAKIANLDVDRYSGHSLRRTKPSIIYKETNNIEVVRRLLGHGSTLATSRYLDVGEDEVERIAREFVV